VSIIAKRIRFFRNRLGITQKRLGILAGLSERTADVRMAQYETGYRTPRPAILRRFADTLGVSVDALAIPDLDTPAGLMHTLFALEDFYGVEIEQDGEDFFYDVEIEPDGTDFLLRLRARPESGKVWPALAEWNRRRAAMKAGTCSREAYDQWRYHFRVDTK